MSALGVLGARTLLGAPGIASRNKDAISTMSAYDGHECLGGLLGARTLLGAPGLTRNKDATRPRRRNIRKHLPVQSL